RADGPARPQPGRGVLRPRLPVAGGSDRGLGADGARLLVHRSRASVRDRGARRPELQDRQAARAALARPRTKREGGQGAVRRPLSGTRVGRPAAPVGWTGAALFAVAVLYLVSHALYEHRAFWITDNANKFLQLRAILDGHGDFSLRWPGRELDPDFELNPLPPPFSRV